MKLIALVLLALIPGMCATTAAWRQASESELRDVIPARAPVQNERIETEFRTASGITDGKGRFVAGVVLITAGYSADGKYSHFLLVQAPLRIGNVPLGPGEYVFGWNKGEDSLHVKFYNAHSGELLGTADATRTSRAGHIEQFRMSTPGENAVIQIGRFAMPYELQDPGK
jgi:hypothetical protein